MRGAIAKLRNSDYIAANQRSLERPVRKAKTKKQPAASRPEVESEPESDRSVDDADSGGDTETETEAGTGRAAASTDNVGDISVEVNVEDLIAQIETENKGGLAPDGSARRKIEDILEEKRVAKEIMDLEDFDIGD